MSNPSFLAQPQVQPLRQLISEVKEGQILIPRFQRPFVWKDEQRLSLLDSINRGIPVGSLMVWRTSSLELGVYERLGPFVLPPAPTSGMRSYLLDGHQRVSTLYGALAGDGADSDDATDDVRWPMYFDLEDEEGARAFKLPSSRRGWSAPITWLPLAVLLDPVELFEFQKKLLELDRKDLARKAEHVANRFKDYPIPITPLVTDDLELVTTTFRRINSQGTPMSEAHMLNAIMWAKNFDLLEALEGIVEHARSLGWSSLDVQAVVDMLKALTGQGIYKARLEAISDELRKDGDLLDRLRTSISHAVSFLTKKCSVRGMRSLPYKYQLVALVTAAHEVGSLDGRRAARLERWLWRTTYSEVFTGMSSGRLRVTISDVVDLARSPRAMITEPSIEVRPMPTHRRGTVRGTAFELQLARLSPRDPATGEPLPAAELLARDAESPISRLIPKQRRRLPKLVGLDGPENFVCLPEDRVGELRERLDEATSNRTMLEVFESHAITPPAAKAWAAGDYQRFLSLRRERLCDDERRFVDRFGMTYVDED